MPNTIIPQNPPTNESPTTNVAENNLGTFKEQFIAQAGAGLGSYDHIREEALVWNSIKGDIAKWAKTEPESSTQRGDIQVSSSQTSSHGFESEEGYAFITFKSQDTEIEVMVHLASGDLRTDRITLNGENVVNSSTKSTKQLYDQARKELKNMVYEMQDASSVDTPVTEISEEAKPKTEPTDGNTIQVTDETTTEPTYQTSTQVTDETTTEPTIQNLLTQSSLTRNTNIPNESKTETGITSGLTEAEIETRAQKVIKVLESDRFKDYIYSIETEDQLLNEVSSVNQGSSPEQKSLVTGALMFNDKLKQIKEEVGGTFQAAPDFQYTSLENRGEATLKAILAMNTYLRVSQSGDVYVQNDQNKLFKVSDNGKLVEVDPDAVPTGLSQPQGIAQTYTAATKLLGGSVTPWDTMEIP